ncbi:unnamed protein product [Clonostachys rosea]|uniref:Uncharacterized protein n=1 Tax=Bionectria ochroleuca TaxID=29856 RepID=A0ABY6U490_BIOOC|nr:unnamed protein product [Clonostachys rosea]
MAGKGGLGQASAHETGTATGIENLQFVITSIYHEVFNDGFHGTLGRGIAQPVVVCLVAVRPFVIEVLGLFVSGEGVCALEVAGASYSRQAGHDSLDFLLLAKMLT